MIIVCEWLGGFDAVTWTDLLQSIILLAAFISVPVTFAYYYGDLAGAGDVFGYDCPNYFVMNCTQPEFAAFGSPCAASSSAAAFKSGVSAQHPFSSWLFFPSPSPSSSLAH